VILDSGMGMSSNAWALVQPTVARVTRACSYDCAGYGWSEAGGPADSVATLHRLLKKAGVTGPYVLAGHSLGSILARIFAHRYPSDTAGLVLVASSYVEESSEPAESDPLHRMVTLMLWMNRIGLLRLIPERFYPDPLLLYLHLLRKCLSAEASASEISFLFRSQHVEAVVREWQADFDAADAAARAHGFGDIPLIVLSERWIFSEKSTEREKAEASREQQRQQTLVALSTRGRQVEVYSGHLIPLEQPETVVRAIEDVVKEVRRNGRRPR
jgi:pimeloyl-ACP methyl ester carboxylesterase